MFIALKSFDIFEHYFFQYVWDEFDRFWLCDIVLCGFPVLTLTLYLSPLFPFLTSTIHCFIFYISLLTIFFPPSLHVPTCPCPFLCFFLHLFCLSSSPSSIFPYLPILFYHSPCFLSSFLPAFLPCSSLSGFLLISFFSFHHFLYTFLPHFLHFFLPFWLRPYLLSSPSSVSSSILSSSVAPFLPSSLLLSFIYPLFPL